MTNPVPHTMTGGGSPPLIHNLFVCLKTHTLNMHTPHFSTRLCGHPSPSTLPMSLTHPRGVLCVDMRYLRPPLIHSLYVWTHTQDTHTPSVSPVQTSVSAISSYVIYTPMSSWVWHNELDIIQIMMLTDRGRWNVPPTRTRSGTSKLRCFLRVSFYKFQIQSQKRIKKTQVKFGPQFTVK